LPSDPKSRELRKNKFDPDCILDDNLKPEQ
jgi:hypothetical protein